MRSKFATLRGWQVQQPSVTRWIAGVSLSLMTVRFVVLYCEAFSAVRSERMADEDLIELCSRGAAADSVKFRSLCLQAKADRAAPILLKATLRAVRTCFADFVESFNSPSRLAILALFCLSGLALPIVKAVSSFVTAHAGATDVLGRLHGLHDSMEGGEESQDDCEVVVLNGGGRAPWMSRLRPRFGSHGRRVRQLTLGALHEPDDEGGMEGVGWSQVRLGST